MIIVFDWLWQGLAIAGAAAVLLAAARRLDAASRYAVWCAAGIAVAALPAVSMVGRWRFSNALPPGGGSLDAALVLPPPPEWVGTAGVTLWAVFALWQLARIVHSLLGAASLARDATPLDAAIASRLTHSRETAAADRRVEVRVSEASIGACAIGIGRPTILVSRGLVEALSPEELDAVILHERSHLERRDDRARLLQALMQMLAGWHPALWIVNRGLDLEREAACDDRVVSRTGTPTTYARALVRAAEIRAGSALPLIAPAAFESASMLRRRICRLIDPSRRLEPRTRLRTGALLVPALGAAAVVAVSSPIVVAFAEVERAMATVPAAAIRAMESARQRRPIASVSTTRPRRQVAEAPSAAPRDVGDAVQMSAAAASPDTQAAPARETPSAAPLDAEPPAPLPASPFVVLTSAGLAPPSAPEPQPAGWAALTRAASTTSARAAEAGAATGASARETGLAIGRFFTRTAKGIGGQF